MAGWGWDANSDTSFQRPTPRHVNAKLVKIEASEEKPKAKKAKKVQKAKKEKKVKKKDDTKKKALALKRKKEAERKKQAVAEKKRKVAVAKAEEERKAEEKRREEEERKRNKELEEQRRIEAEQQLALALEDEEEFVAAESDEEIVASYMDIIDEAVNRRWSRPPSARRGMVVVLRIHLIPTGQVVSVNVVKSSGNEAFDRSARNAVNKAERFPELQNMPGRVFEANFRRFLLKFTPEDLRL